MSSIKILILKFNQKVLKIKLCFEMSEATYINISISISINISIGFFLTCLKALF